MKCTIGIYWMMNETYAMVNTMKDTYTLKCIRNLTPLLQKMATWIEELKKKTCKFQKLCEQLNCCKIQSCFNWINFLKSFGTLVVAIENWNHESSKLTKAQNHRSAKKWKAKRSNGFVTFIISTYGSSLISP